MDDDVLLHFATEIGFQLQACGGETFRVEESVRRVLAAYGAHSGEVFAIPNCLIVSLTGVTGEPLTRVRRQPPHGTDIYRLELLNDFCRRVCRERPPLAEAGQELAKICADRTLWPLWGHLLAYFAGTAAFSMLFGARPTDALCSGICGCTIGLCLRFMSKLGTNLFFKTVAGALVSALLAVLLTALGLGRDTDQIIIGALMALVPGISITTAMRDIIAGDMISGLTKSAEALLVGVAIAVGTGLALTLSRPLWGG